MFSHVSPPSSLVFYETCVRIFLSLPSLCIIVANLGSLWKRSIPSNNFQDFGCPTFRSVHDTPLNDDHGIHHHSSDVTASKEVDSAQKSIGGSNSTAPDKATQCPYVLGIVYVNEEVFL